ncbi:unnamed protein product [Caenorhabditis angaria]|uniref:Uncharacterized protein n=1 Tax=Caenorhabditis angaria TaxID=860376 RepID=A0A9P1IIY3_9PELO|nr:unnamed protein product [Caenorhabditis angaria]
MLDEKIVVDCVTLKHFNQLEIIDLLRMVQFLMKQLDAGILMHFKLKRNVSFLWMLEAQTIELPNINKMLSGLSRACTN